MGKNTYNQILDFIETYGGNQYKMLKKCNPGQELDYMTKGSESGKAAREAFTSIVNTIGTSFDLKAGKVTQWQNSGTFVSYFWSQLKRAARSVCLCLQKRGRNLLGSERVWSLLLKAQRIQTKNPIKRFWSCH